MLSRVWAVNSRDSTAGPRTDLSLTTSGRFVSVPPASTSKSDRRSSTRTARIDALVAKVRDAIDRLKELRTALISAAVTGKIDVREEVA